MVALTDRQLGPTVFEVRRHSDSVRAREQVAEVARDAGLSSRQTAELAIAVSELVTSVLKFAGFGHVELHRLSCDGRGGVLIRVQDTGPAIDGEPAAVDCRSGERALAAQAKAGAQRGFGADLDTVGRLLDQVTCEPTAEGGTRIIGMKWATTE